MQNRCNKICSILKDTTTTCLNCLNAENQSVLQQKRCKQKLQKVPSKKTTVHQKIHEKSFKTHKNILFTPKKHLPSSRIGSNGHCGTQGTAERVRRIYALPADLPSFAFNGTFPEKPWVAWFTTRFLFLNKGSWWYFCRFV